MRTMFLVGAVVVLASRAASASLVQIESNAAGSTDLLGSFTGSVSYTADAATTGTLVISLTNTNTPAEGGYITGLVFNLPTPDVGKAELASSSIAGFTDLGPTESASPYGIYDTGAALGGSWLGGGSPSGGIAVGQTGTFTFTITATNAAALSAELFVQPGSSPSPLIRFRGFANGGSDKVPGTLVPTPTTLALAAVGGLLASRRRR